LSTPVALDVTSCFKLFRTWWTLISEKQKVVLHSKSPRFVTPAEVCQYRPSTLWVCWRFPPQYLILIFYKVWFKSTSIVKKYQGWKWLFLMRNIFQFRYICLSNLVPRLFPSSLL
jgi:hypothetical protein